MGSRQRAVQGPQPLGLNLDEEVVGMYRLCHSHSMALARDGRCLGRLQHRRVHLHGEDGLALQNLAARYRPAALRQPHLERGRARWAVDLEPGGGRRRAKAARHGRRTPAGRTAR